MKNFLVLLFVLVGSCVFAQQAKPSKPGLDPVKGQNIQTPKDSVVYLVPTDTRYDTAQVYGVLAQIKQPLFLQKFNLITKQFIYENGQVKPAEQWLEDVNFTRIDKWRERLIWVTQSANID